MQNVIEITNLKKTYDLPKADRKDGQTTFDAVKGTTFSVEKGEIFGILGPNGAGKTTTLEIIEGLKAQTSGQVKVLGLDNVSNVDEIKKRIGVQLQASEYMTLMSLGELLELFASLYKKDADIDELLGFVNLVDKKNALVKDLSGGQKQRFTLASSLVNDPEILFLDEPTTGLDPRARRDVWELVRRIHERGITVVLTTHYMEEAEYLCNRVAIMDAGEILAINDPRKLIDDLSHTTQISFLTDSEISENVFEGINGVEKMYSTHPKMIVEVNNLDIIGDVVRRLRERNVPFSSFTVKTATLEDVYLDLTGKAFEE
ncbi:MAG TPA: ABC transporter ATP-binding protein [Patescibacteria group bacterium]|jgi:ABC-2 type transport system ATP-binding protein|nr:ABC transporter ATP-binding protein [Patescibacteria group bacterium]